MLRWLFGWGRRAKAKRAKSRRPRPPVEPTLAPPVWPEAPRVRDESITRMEFLLNLRRHGISDQAVLRAMDQVPREHFVDGPYQDDAYADRALPIACGQTISQPYVVAYMTEQLGVERTHRVLEVGTGSGYQTAILGLLAREVVTVERYRTLLETAKSRLATLGIDNVDFVAGDGLGGVPQYAPYDRIMVTAAAEALPPALGEQLAEGGVMILPIGPQDGEQHLVRVTKTPEGLQSQTLIGVRFVPLLPGQAREL